MSQTIKGPSKPARSIQFSSPDDMPKRGARVVLVAVNGFGKTTAGAMMPNPVMILAPQEDGYLTLHKRGLVPSVPMLRVKSWDETLMALDELATNPGDRQTVVCDAIVGFEHLLAHKICHRDFEGDWGERGFRAWNSGPATVAREWPQLLVRLDRCADAGLDVILLGHASIRSFSPPDGPAYDRYECSVTTKEVWARTKDWGEAVLFGTFQATVDQVKTQTNAAKAKGKAVSEKRVLRCRYSAYADAKNQYGLDAVYDVPDDPAQWSKAFHALIHNGDNT